MMTSVCDNDDTKDKDHLVVVVVVVVTTPHTADHLVVGTQMHETIAFFHEQKRSGLN